jgi:hypothetical protein
MSGTWGRVDAPLDNLLQEKRLAAPVVLVSTRSLCSICGLTRTATTFNVLLAIPFILDC